jgi:DNA-binding response OmpR family regulator
MKILICDDDPDISGMIAACLTMRGHQTSESYGGLEALRLYHRALLLPPDGKTETEPFDVVLLDLAMPDIDGFSACENIRNVELHSPLAPRARIIFITAHPEIEENTTLLRKCDADAYLVKPFSCDDLTTLLTPSEAD